MSPAGLREAAAMQTVDEIEHKLRALQLPEAYIQRHLQQVRRLRTLPRRRWIRVRTTPGRHPRWHWEMVEG
jgi:hypothetical protein